MKLKQIIFLFFTILYGNNLFSQLLYYQDCYHGGFTGAGFSTGLGIGSGQFEIYIEPSSTIRKAFLVYQRFQIPHDYDITINNITYNLNLTDEISNYYIHNSGHTENSGVHLIDITNDLDSNINLFNINLPNRESSRAGVLYNNIFFYVMYENNSLPKVNTNIILNTQDLEDNNNKFYYINGVNPIDTSFAVGFGMHSDRINIPSIFNDGSNVYFNSTLLGLVGGPDQVNVQHSTYGVKGHFYYQNNQFFGLDDDIPNTTMQNSDAIADVSSLIAQNATSYNFNLQWQDLNATRRTNIYTSFYLAYSTPCDTFSAALLAKDTTVCVGESVQLAATGGQKYEWQPSAGLSCDTCVNPIASPTESTTYTVRIFNNDSCSKVFPVRLNISQPKPDTITTKRSICGDDNGEINIGEIPLWRLSKAPLVYTVNGDTVQGPEIINISPGNKELIITDANGCQFSDSLFIDEANITQSRIVYLDPDKGNAPLEITARPLLVNYIQNHQFVWIVNGDTIHTGNSNIFNYTFDVPGEYELIHITYNQYPHCADTTSTTILVYPSFFANIPNVFSPNGDGVNDVFEIKVSNTQSVSWQIKNRWGQLVSEGSQEVEGSHTQKIPLWDGSNAADGVYFYLITATDFNGNVYEKQGKVSLFK